MATTAELLEKLDKANGKLEQSKDEIITQQRALIEQLMSLLLALLAKQA